MNPAPTQHSDAAENRRGIVAMVVSMATFTLNDAFMKSVTQSLPLMQSIAIRGGLTIIALVILGRIIGGLTFRLPRRDRVMLAWRTVGEVGATFTFLTALMHMPLANLAAIMQAMPLAVTLAAAVFLAEPVGWRRMSAIAVGFAGVLFIVKPGTGGFDVWSLVALSSVAFVVLRDLSTRQFSAGLPTVLVALSAAVSVTAMGLLGMIINGGWVPVTGAELGKIAIASSALVLGYVCSVRAMRHGEVALIAPFRYTALLWAILFGWIGFRTLPDYWTWVGAALVVASGLFALWRQATSRRKVPAMRGLPESAHHATLEN